MLRHMLCYYSNCFGKDHRNNNVLNQNGASFGVLAGHYNHRHKLCCRANECVYYADLLSS